MRASICDSPLQHAVPAVSVHMHLCFSSEVEGKVPSTDHSYVYHNRCKHGEAHDGGSPVPTKYDLMSISANERGYVKHQDGRRARGLCAFNA